MADIEFSGILYARVNSANLAIAQSNSGVGSDLTAQIAPPTLEAGTITISSADPGVITGVGTSLSSNDIGKYIYGYDVSNDPILGGQVAAVGSTTSATLTAVRSSTITARPFGYSFTLLTTIEPVIVAVPSNPPNDTSTYIPDYTEWRVSPKTVVTTYNDPTVSQLSRYSVAGTPLTIDGSPDNTPFTIEPIQIFTEGSTANSYWPTASDLPTWTFALLNPFGNSGLALSANTMFRWTTQAFLTAILVSANTAKASVRAAGYK